MKYAPTQVIAIDVDNTLFIRGQPNKALIIWIKLKKQEGYDILIWSACGTEHATNAARIAGIDSISMQIGKPGYIVDDKRWGWIKHTQALLPHMINDCELRNRGVGVGCPGDIKTDAHQS